MNKSQFTKRLKKPNTCKTDKMMNMVAVQWKWVLQLPGTAAARHVSTFRQKITLFINKRV